VVLTAIGKASRAAGTLPVELMRMLRDSEKRA
jgi:hypothetical protein